MMNLPAIRNLTDPQTLATSYREELPDHPELLKEKVRQAAILWTSFNAAAAAMYPILGKVIDHVQRTKAWETWGFQSFGDFMTRGMEQEYRVDRTKAYDAWKLVRNWPELGAYEAEQIGTMKLRELKKVEFGLTRLTRIDWLERAKEMPVSEFQEAVATHIGSTVAGQKLKRVEFTLRQETLDLWEETIASVILKTGTEDWNAIVEALCGEWASK